MSIKPWTISIERQMHFELNFYELIVHEPCVIKNVSHLKKIAFYQLQ